MTTTTIQYHAQEGYPYNETLRAAATAETSAHIGEVVQYLWPTMDYMVENGRFNRAVRHARVIFALCELGL